MCAPEAGSAAPPAKRGRCDGKRKERTLDCAASGNLKKAYPHPNPGRGRFLYREEKSEGFQRAESDAVAALTVEQHDVVAGKADAVLLPDGEQAAAEYHAGEQEPIDINLDGGFHTGGHGAVNFTLEGGFTGDVEELGTDAENQILIGEDGFQRVPAEAAFGEGTAVCGAD